MHRREAAHGHNKGQQPQLWDSSLYMDAEGQLILAGPFSGIPAFEHVKSRHQRPSALTPKPKPTARLGRKRPFSELLAEEVQEEAEDSESSQSGGLTDDDDDEEGEEDDDDDEGRPILSDSISHAEVWSLCASVCDQDLMDKLIRQHLTKTEALYRERDTPHVSLCVLVV